MKKDGPFYRGMVVADDGTRMCWFADQNICQFFSQQFDLNLQMDGTFQVLPKLGSAQLFIIHARHEDMVSAGVL